MTFYFPNKPLHIYDPQKLMETLAPTQEHWIVQPKWNGKRVEIDCTKEGLVTLYGRQGQRFPERWPWLNALPLPRPWFLDGELLRDGRIYVWDVAVLGGKLLAVGPARRRSQAPLRSLIKRPYQERLNRLYRALGPTPFNDSNSTQRLQLIETLPATAYKALLSREGDPMLEGIVWKNLQATNLWGPTSTSQVSSMFKLRFAELGKEARKKLMTTAPGAAVP